MIVFFCAFVENYVSGNQLLWTRFVKTGASVYLFSFWKHGLLIVEAVTKKTPTFLTEKVA